MQKNMTSKAGYFLSKRWIKVDRNHGIAVCTNDKVGSSTWSYHLRDLLPENIFRKLPKLYHTNENRRRRRRRRYSI